MSNLATELNKAQALNYFQRVWWNMRWLPVAIDINRTARKAAKDPEKMKELKKKCFGDDAVKDEFKMSPKETEKAAQEMHNEQDASNVSATIVRAVEENFDDILTQQKIIERGINTQKLINYAYFFMCDERASLIKRPQIEKEIINGIAAIFGFPKIYESAGIAGLKQYDIAYPDEFLETSKFILSIADIQRKLKDPCFMEKVKARMEMIQAESACPQDDPPEEDDGTVMKANFEEIKIEPKQDDSNPSTFWKVDDKEKAEKIVKPIFYFKKGNGKEEFDYEASINSLPMQGVGISDELFTKLEESVGKICQYKHRYEAFGDLVKMYVNRGGGIEDTYIVDPGIIMGCGLFSVIAHIPEDNDTIFVSTTHQEILNKVFENAYYILNTNELQEVIQDYFRNLRIYKYLDMSYTDELRLLNEDDFQKLGKKITYILNQVAKQSNGTEMPRFRINYWNGIDDFLMISDPTVKSPMSYDNTTSPIICEGLMYEVKGDDIIQRYMGTEVHFHIDKYGDL